MAHTIYKNSKGERVKSVTTIIGGSLGWNKQMLMAWQAREFKSGNDPTLKTQKASDKGTSCHEYISSYFYNRPMEESFKKDFDLDAIVLAERAVEQFKQALKEQEYEILDSELPLVSEVYQYAGCLDGRMKHGSKIVLFDIKTSKGIYSDH